MASINTNHTSRTFYSSTSSPKDADTPESSSSTSTNPSDRALPAPGESATTLDVSGGGTTIKLDHLGPLVVNVDGTMSRITNWSQMADIEKENTLRILGRRNKQRLEAVKKAKENE
ncbi:hypothetical protein VFPPC_00878 [Pochonia chlamydosporia 170]|uniref:Uncharacterized protein n=1 Tax=Pochonia chlamydosporia 170 TaxID=1380566 RepID=A0A179G5H1_METCM|nr:hypothetical protein VFPPC_00878 [Pochonia chlamydosporia 170]OAQ73074.1 hypothetical protein VFPPC_00878 [Pochonia chlamydosporia 170]